MLQFDLCNLQMSWNFLFFKRHTFQLCEKEISPLPVKILPLLEKGGLRALQDGTYLGRGAAPRGRGEAGAGPQRVVGADGRAARAEEPRGAVRVASGGPGSTSRTRTGKTEKTGTRRCSPNYSVEKDKNPTLIVFGK